MSARRVFRNGAWQPAATSSAKPADSAATGTAQFPESFVSVAERYAHLLDAINERVNGMPCDRARYAPDVMEFTTDGACAHCDLLDLLESEPK